MEKLFELCSGSIPGRDHLGRGGLLFGKNNQDAVSWMYGDDFLVATVSDGCGSEVHSEVGAKIISRLIVANAASLLRRNGSASQNEEFWELVRQDTLAQLRVLAHQLGGDQSFTAIVQQYLLCTAVTALITENHVQIVAIGDGLFGVNGSISEIGPFPGNKPPYLAYGLVQTDFSAKPELLRFKVVALHPTDTVQSLLIGTDGVRDLKVKANCLIPGQKSEVGELSQFWLEDRYFKNKDAVRRKLALINSEVTNFNHQRKEFVTEQGLLPDDTTFVVVRRKLGSQDSLP